MKPICVYIHLTWIHTYQTYSIRIEWIWNLPETGEWKEYEIHEAASFYQKLHLTGKDHRYEYQQKNPTTT
jgi:hypothetical protein